MRMAGIAACAFCVALGCSSRSVGGQVDDGGRVDDSGADAGYNNNNPVPPDAHVGPCNDDPVPVFEGEYQLLINDLVIGTSTEGMDLDSDGEPDNVMAPFGTVLNGPLRDSFMMGEIYIPMELYGIDDQGIVDNDCVNLTFYDGDFPPDQDHDGERTSGMVGRSGNDCNDWHPGINPNALETVGDRVDNDCDGMADETGSDIPSTDVTDADGDGYSLADGDCDDRQPLDWPGGPDWWDPTLINPGSDEICGDGFDNDCDGLADESCNPYQPPLSLEDMCTIPIDLASLTQDAQEALVVFRSGRIENHVLAAGPSLFKFETEVDLRTTKFVVTYAFVEATVNGYLHTSGLVLENGRVGGVLNGPNLDRMPNFAEDFYGVKSNTMLDVIVGPGGLLLGLPSIGLCMVMPQATVEQPLPPDPCLTSQDCPDPDNFFCDWEIRPPDIDVDLDGIELFLDLNLDDDPDVFRVDTCVDGDGTVVQDTYQWAGDVCVTHRDCSDAYGSEWSCSQYRSECYAVAANCTEAEDGLGNPRFLDGFSILFRFTAIPTNLEGTFDSGG